MQIQKQYQQFSLIFFSNLLLQFKKKNNSIISDSIFLSLFIKKIIMIKNYNFKRLFMRKFVYIMNNCIKEGVYVKRIFCIKTNVKIIIHKYNTKL